MPMRSLLVIAVLLISCTTQTVVPPASPSATSQPSTTVVSPSAPATSAPSAAPTDFYGPIVTRALGPLRGDQVLWIQEQVEKDTGTIRVDLMAMPLTGGAPQVAVSYRKSAGGVSLEPQNAIARQLSSDGRRIVLHTPKGIVLIDLETGSQRILAVGVLPVWRVGETIAYYKPISEATYGGGDIWLVDTNGHERQFPAQGAPLAWSGDGALMIGRLEPSGRLTPVLYGFALGQFWQPFTSFKDFISPGGQNVVSLTTKPGTPNFIAAMALTDARGDNSHIDVISLIGSTTQDVGPRVAGSFVDLRLEEPRLNSVGQILYQRHGAGVREVHVFDPNTRSDAKATVTGLATRAEWSLDGDQIVYLSADPRDGQTSTVRMIRPISGRDDRELYRVPDTSIRLTDVATFRYAP